MNGREFIRRVEVWAKTHDVICRVTKGRRKGGHQMLDVADRRTFVQTGEIPIGTLHAMLKQLHISREDF
ncbi:hypothetical protein [Caulobacter sp. S45]|uniref:hypothetical protein n=1 Tax=Caulobacter sp. S45 TaxID=1641861 RepID=UPI001575B04C|nr:hypothetical protein [Caulobacter sp. S45]